MARKKLTKEERHQVYEIFGGRCAYCGCKINENNFEADHLEPVRELDGEMLNPENDDISNFFPSCKSCNRLKGSLPIEYFRKKIEDQLRQFNEYNSHFRLMIRFNLIKPTPHKVRFYFEDARKTLYNKLSDNQKDIDKDIQDVVNDNFYEIL